MNSTHSWDPAWEKVFQEQEWGKYPGESLIQFIAGNFYKKNRSNVKILEVGCGTGANIWYLAREGFDSYGIDGSPTAIDIASKRISTENLKANLSVGDIVQLPFENDFFDCVLDVECLYANNWENSCLIIREIARVLKNNGLFYSRTFSSDMFVGDAFPISDYYEYDEVEEGPLSGKGFVRLINRDLIKELYGKTFDIRSIDLLEHTRDNGRVKISEWIITAEKKC